MFTQISEHVGPIIERHKLSGSVLASRICSAWPGIIKSVLGHNFPFPKAILFKEHVLWLKMTDSVVSQEIQLAKKQIIEHYAKLFTQEAVHDIRFRLQGTIDHDARDIGRTA